MTPVSSIPRGVSSSLPCGESRSWWVHRVSLPARWRAHFSMTSTSKHPVFIWGCAFGCKFKCWSCPAFRGSPQILKFPCDPSRDCQITTADLACWDEKWCATRVYSPFVLWQPADSLPLPVGSFQLLTLHWGYLNNHNISIMRYQFACVLQGSWSLVL